MDLYLMFSGKYFMGIKTIANQENGKKIRQFVETRIQTANTIDEGKQINGYITVKSTLSGKLNA